jgi:hypothetical protein
MGDAVPFERRTRLKGEPPVNGADGELLAEAARCMNYACYQRVNFKKLVKTLTFIVSSREDIVFSSPPLGVEEVITKADLLVMLAPMECRDQYCKSEDRLSIQVPRDGFASYQLNGVKMRKCERSKKTDLKLRQG